MVHQLGGKMQNWKAKNRRMFLESLQSRCVFAAYFIDPIHGSDSNSGLAPDAALATPAELVSYYNYADRPAGYKGLQPGDEVVLMPGVHDFTYRYDQTTRGFFLRGVHGTADKPIVIRGMPGAQVRSKASDGSELAPIDILQSSYITISGLDVSANGWGVFLAETKGVVVRDNFIHDVDGEANNNAAGIYLTGADNTVVENNLLVDNYDRQKIGNQNNRHIVIFGSRNVRILENEMRNSIPNAGLGVEFKHLGGITPDEKYIFEVARNLIVNCTDVGIGSSAANSHVHHNLLIDSGPIRFDDIGGWHQLAGELAEFNTIVNTIDHTGSGGLLYDPTETHGFPMGTVEWKNNLVVDQRRYSENERNTVAIHQYGNDEEYLNSIGRGLLSADGNVYSTLNPARFNVFGANHYLLGNVFDFTGWQNAGYDRNGAVIGSTLDTSYQSSDPIAKNAGWYANDKPRLTLLVDRIDLNESGEQSQAKLRVVRSGGSLDQPIVVSLSTSASGEIRLPSNVTIPAGQSSVEIPLYGIADSTVDSTIAIQIGAAALGLEDSVAWVRLHDSPPGVSNPTNPVEGVFQIPGPLGTKIDLSSLVTMRWAEYNNEIGFAYVDDASGRVGNLGPSDAGWLQALLGRSQNQVLHHSGATEGDQSHSKVEAGRFLVFYLVQDATTDDWSRNNPTNDLSLQPHLFVSVEASNPDRFDHLRERGNGNRWKLEWEDLDFGGDKSFRDMVLDVNFAEAIPKPSNPNTVDDVFRLYSGEGLQRLDVLKNDFFANPDKITAVSNSAAGNVSVANDGNAIEFTPAQGFFGYVQFTYTLLSQGVPSTANVQVDVVKRWTNPKNNLDVNADGQLTLLDALVVINALNRAKPIQAIDHPSSDDTAVLAMVDVNGDSQVTFLDALAVIVGLL